LDTLDNPKLPNWLFNPKNSEMRGDAEKNKMVATVKIFKLFKWAVIFVRAKKEEKIKVDVTRFLEFEEGCDEQ